MRPLCRWNMATWHCHRKSLPSPPWKTKRHTVSIRFKLFYLTLCMRCLDGTAWNEIWTQHQGFSRVIKKMWRIKKWFMIWHGWTKSDSWLISEIRLGCVMTSCPCSLAVLFYMRSRCFIDHLTKLTQVTLVEQYFGVYHINTCKVFIHQESMLKWFS